MQRLRRMATAVAAAVVAAGLGVTVAASPAAAATPVLGFGHFVLASFGADAGSWHTDKHPRFVVDITGDHRADIVGFGDAGVYTSIATGGGGFTSPSFVIGDFGFDQGWRVTYEPPVVPTPRFVTDITGDGRADIVGVGNAGIYTAVSNGNGTFGPMTFQPGSFAARSCFGGAWATDINGDGRNDIICLSHLRLQVAISLGNGNFAAPVLASTEFAVATMGFPTSNLSFADFTRDARADLLDVRFGINQPFVSRTASPRADNTFPTTSPAGANFPSTGQSGIPSAIVDVNGDGCNDLIGLSDVLYRALGNCNDTFQNYVAGIADFGFTSGWDFLKHVRLMGDITGDGRADIVGFGNDGVFTANGQSNGFFSSTRLAVTDFAYNAGGWRIQDNPRVLADITGDGRADIVGFGNAGVYVAVSSGDGGFV